MYVVCDTAMIQTDPSGFIRRPTKFDRRRLNLCTLANLWARRSHNEAREMVAVGSQLSCDRIGTTAAGSGKKIFSQRPFSAPLSFSPPLLSSTAMPRRALSRKHRSLDFVAGT